MAPRNETREINTMQTEELDNYIGLFLLSIRKADGEQYEPDTLTSYHRCIDGYLRDKKYPFTSRIKDKELQIFMTVFASKRNECTGVIQELMTMDPYLGKYEQNRSFISNSGQHTLTYEKIHNTKTLYMLKHGHCLLYAL